MDVSGGWVGGWVGGRRLFLTMGEAFAIEGAAGVSAAEEGGDAGCEVGEEEVFVEELDLREKVGGWVGGLGRGK